MFLQALCLVVVLYAVLSEAVTSHQPSGVQRRRPPSPGPANPNRVQRAGPPSRMRNLAKRAHHSGPGPAKRGFYPPQRVPYSKPFPHRKTPKFPPYNKPHKPAFNKGYTAPQKGYSRPPKSSYESYSKPMSYGSYSPNSYHPKPYLPSSYQYNPPQGASYSTQSSSSKFANQAPGYAPPSFATSSQNSNSHSVQSPSLTSSPSHVSSHSHSIGGSSLHALGTAPHSGNSPSHSIGGSLLHSLGSSPQSAVSSSQSLGPPAHTSSLSIGSPAHSSVSHSIGSSSFAAPSSLSSYSSSTGSSYSVGTGSLSQAASTTYGVPHPTHGAPQPPSYASFASSTYPKDSSDQATSYVHFYQGNEAPKDSLTPASSANTYSYTSTHYTENKHKGSVFDSDLGGSETKVWNHQESKDKRATKKSKEDSGSFKAPKQTFGFLPYDSDSTRHGDKESSYSLGQGYYTDSVLSPNYYEQQSSSSS